jgi:geranylgeranyl diphosphate synthase type II
VTERTYRSLYDRCRKSINSRLLRYSKTPHPAVVYDPIRHILSAGGKRVRPVLTMLACEAVGGRAAEALDAAAAIEMLHTFTLVHDDVMDHAAVRRGKPTIHTKWDENAAILAGDALAALAYRAILRTENRLTEVLGAFNDAFITVCDGQGFDKEFELRTDITVDRYLLMIRKKTARMISASAEIGALIGGGTPHEVRALRSFGEHLGTAFQIQDDLLDIEGTPEEFGKAIGGDVKEGKRTYLLVRALELTGGADRRFLSSLAPGANVTQADIRRVRAIYHRAGVLDDARNAMERITIRAQRSLLGLKATPARSTLMWISAQLLKRNR